MVRDFRIVRRLGVGGFAFVYQTERAGSSYSLKMAARPFSAEDEDQVDAWMRREVASLEHLEHPNLLPVLEWGRWPDPATGYAWFVTPYVSARTFHSWRWHERASLHRSISVLCEALKPLEVMHTHGMCHRDLKADNLLVRKGDEKPFLIDLGSVHLPCARTLTEGLAPGTLHCQPPEAISFLVSEAMHKGARLKAQPGADLYALGLLLYEILTNCRPFSTRLSLEQLLVAIATMPPREPGQLAPDAPASLCALTLRLLAKKPEHRPSSVRAMREELERLLQQEGHTDSWQVPARRPSECARLGESFPDVDVLEEIREPPSAPVPPPPPPPPTETPPAGHTRRARRRSRWLVTLALGLGLLGLGWTLLRVSTAPPREDGSRAEATAPATPAPSEKGTRSVPSSTPSDTRFRDASESAQPPSRLCALLTSLLGTVAAQLAGCATAPVRPDPIRYLSSCSPEARATPVTLGIKPDEQSAFLKTGTPASDSSIEDGGALNLKPGPVTADMLVMMKGQEQYLKITGEAVTTPNRVYIQFDRLYLPDGTSMPICGVAVDDLHQYGIPTYAKLPIEGNKVDPAMVDKSPGSVVLNDPTFETVLQGPKGYYVPRVNLAPPDWR
jgi:serine/threonine-protein kinase